MSKLEELKEKIKEARKNKDTRSLSIYSTLLGEYESRSKEVSDKDEDIILQEAADKMIKSLKETVDNSVNEASEEAEKELDFIKEFGTQKLSEEEHREIIKEVIESSPTDEFGKLMGQVMGRIGNKGDGKLAKEILNEELSKK